MRRLLVVPALLVTGLLAASCGATTGAQGPRTAPSASSSVPTEEPTAPPTSSPGASSPGASSAPPSPVPASPPPLTEVEVGLELVSDQIDQPLAVEAGPDGATYVAAQRGVIWRVDARGDATRWLDLSDRVLGEGEGLLDIAFLPSGELVVAHYRDSDGDTTIATFPVVDGAADRDRGQVVLRHPQPGDDHNGGALVLAPDGGSLVLGLGDGGAGGEGDPYDQAQDTSTPLGAVVRLPLDDVVAGSVRPEVIVHGLRNPWRLTFDDAGQLYVADVGLKDVEEVTVVPRRVWDAGTGAQSADFGWPVLEGERCVRDAGCDTAGTVPPDVTYDHADVGGCSVIGGPVVPDGPLRGAYLYADYCAGRIWALRARDGEVVEQSELLDDAPPLLTSIGTAADGTIWVTVQDGRILRLVVR